MANILSQKFNKLVDNLAIQITKEPLLRVNKIGDLKYRISCVLFVPHSAHSFVLEQPTVADISTEAGNLQARSFIIKAQVKTPNDTSYSLWTLEAEYSIDAADDFQEYEYVELVLNYPDGPGPETPRGTVTTVEDPDRPNL